MRYILILSIGFLASCTTLERYTYYTPVSDANVSGPNRTSCSPAPKGKPDTAIYSGLEFTSNSSFEPYLWGPLFFTVVPVFPITWIVDGVVNPKLEVNIRGDREKFRILSTSVILASVDLENGEKRSISPESISAGKYRTSIIFPVKSKAVKAFHISMKNVMKEGGDIELQYDKTSRWAWSYWSPNC